MPTKTENRTEEVNFLHHLIVHITKHMHFNLTKYPEHLLILLKEANKEANVLLACVAYITKRLTKTSGMRRENNAAINKNKEEVQEVV